MVLGQRRCLVSVYFNRSMTLYKSSGCCLHHHLLLTTCMSFAPPADFNEKQDSLYSMPFCQLAKSYKGLQLKILSTCIKSFEIMNNIFFKNVEFIITCCSNNKRGSTSILKIILNELLCRVAFLKIASWSSF